MNITTPTRNMPQAIPRPNEPKIKTHIMSTRNDTAKRLPSWGVATSGRSLFTQP